MNELRGVAFLLEAVAFAADRHRRQRRKGVDASPYINHPLEVAHTLASVGGVADPVTLAAAVLHDTIEDTRTTGDELEDLFGRDVRRLVEEVTDDKALPKAERKHLQVVHAPTLSIGAKMVKLADKIANARDVVRDPPADWNLAQRRAYLDWTEHVVAGCRGVNAALEAYYDAVLQKGRAALGDGI